MHMIALVVFLGNYGKEYASTRHNAAWLLEENLPFKSDFNWQEKFKGAYCVLQKEKIVSIAEQVCGVENLKVASNITPKIYFLKPETYMNLSGESIAELAGFYKIKPEEILIVHDELELQPGQVSLKWSGGLGGHNGLRSAKACLGTADFWRLRIGIGRPDHPDVAGYVLSNFTSDERTILSQVFDVLSKLLCRILVENPENFVKEWSKKKVNV